MSRHTALLREAEASLSAALDACTELRLRNDNLLEQKTILWQRVESLRAERAADEARARASSALVGLAGGLARALWLGHRSADRHAARAFRRWRATQTMG